MKIQPSPFWKGEAPPHQMRHDTLMIGSSIAFSEIFLGRGLQTLSRCRGTAAKGTEVKGRKPTYCMVFVLVPPAPLTQVLQLQSVREQLPVLPT